MTPGEARAVLVRDAAELLHWTFEATEPFVTEIARRHDGGMPRPTLNEWMAVHLGSTHPAAQPGFVDAVLRLLDAPVVT